MHTITLEGVVTNPESFVLPDGQYGLRFTFISQDRQRPEHKRFWLVTYQPPAQYLNQWHERLLHARRCLLLGEVYYAVGSQNRISTYIHMHRIYPLMAWKDVITSN